MGTEDGIIYDLRVVVYLSILFYNRIMALIETRIALGELTPIEAYVYQPNLERLGHLRYRGVMLPLVDVVELDKHTKLLVDGSHRSYMALFRGDGDILARVANDDSGVVAMAASAVSLAGCASLEDVRAKYEEIWRPNLNQCGVSRLSDLRVRREDGHRSGSKDI